MQLSVLELLLISPQLVVCLTVLMLKVLNSSLFFVWHATAAFEKSLEKKG